MEYIKTYRTALAWSLAVGLYLKFLLVPTSYIFYELYHLLGIDFVYWGYTLFKGAGYYFGVWEYQTVTCVCVALLLFLLLRHRRNKRLLKMENAR